MAESLTYEERLDVQADVLRQLWHAGHATPLGLSDVLQRSLPQIDRALDDLIAGGYVFPFIRGSQDDPASDPIYCLTRATRHHIEAMLARTTRYRLRRSWDALRREELFALIAS